MSKKRGLGKSLDALLIGSSLAVADESLVAEGPAKEKLSYIPLNQIQRGKYQPRREMDPESLEDLANSIRLQGVLQPIVARHLLGGKYEIVAGERRFRASQMAGLTEIPAIIKDIPDEAAMAIALIENIQREDLNPVEEAMALQRLLNEFSMTHNQVAESIGKSRVTVTNLLRLLTLAEEVKTLLEHGDLEMGHARALLSLSESLQIDAANMIINKNLSVRETEELVRRMQAPKLPEMPKSMDPDVRRLQDDLSERLKLSVAIHCNQKGKGRVVIHYTDLNELDRLMEFFH